MALEQHSQILTPTNIKKRKTIPPELIVDIFKTIGTDKYLFTIYETKYGFIKVLSEDLWNRYAKKLLSCSSIIYLAAKNIFRQVKKKGKFTFYLSKMDAENNPNPEEWPVLTDPLMEALKKASVFQENEANVGNPEMIDYWVVVFKSAMDRIEMYNNEKGLWTNNYEKEIRERDAQIRRLSASQTSNIGLGLLTSASALFNQGIAKLIEARNAFGGGGTPVIGSPTSASKNLCTSMSSSKMIGTPKSPRSTTSTPSSSKRKQVPPGLCPVCELRNKEESAYRIFTCSLCKNFFKRVIGCKFQPTAGCGKNCSKEDLLKCEHCWYMKCLNAGMKSLQQSTHKRKLSMDESEKLPKEIKLAESERKSSDDEAVGGTSPQQ